MEKQKQWPNLYSDSDDEAAAAPKPAPQSKWEKDPKGWVEISNYLQLLDINKEPIGKPISLSSDWRNNPENILHSWRQLKKLKLKKGSKKRSKKKRTKRRSKKN